jgi:hypothetical protein
MPSVAILRGQLSVRSTQFAVKISDVADDLLSALFLERGANVVDKGPYDPCRQRQVLFVKGTENDATESSNDGFAFLEGFELM